MLVAEKAGQQWPVSPAKFGEGVSGPSASARAASPPCAEPAGPRSPRRPPEGLSWVSVRGRRGSAGPGAGRAPPLPPAPGPPPCRAQPPPCSRSPANEQRDRGRAGRAIRAEEAAVAEWGCWGRVALPVSWTDRVARPCAVSDGAVGSASPPPVRAHGQLGPAAALLPPAGTELGSSPAVAGFAGRSGVPGQSGCARVRPPLCRGAGRGLLGGVGLLCGDCGSRGCGNSTLLHPQRVFGTLFCGGGKGEDRLLRCWQVKVKLLRLPSPTEGRWGPFGSRSLVSLCLPCHSVWWRENLPFPARGYLGCTVNLCSGSRCLSASLLGLIDMLLDALGSLFPNPGQGISCDSFPSCGDGKFVVFKQRLWRSLILIHLPLSNKDAMVKIIPTLCIQLLWIRLK